MKNSYQISSKTHVGNRRSLNEDHLDSYSGTDFIVLVVCDGMGGAKKGDLASKIASEEIINHFKNISKLLNVRKEIVFSILNANKKILAFSKKSSEYKGMGTTCAVAVVQKQRIYFGNIGDTRIYKFRNKNLKIISKDHSVVQQLIDKQLILEEEAFSHPRKNELTQALGINEKIDPFIDDDEIENSDLFMICSDGLYNEIVLNNLVEIFKNYSYNLEELNQKLLTTSLENGGNDNISVILLRSGKIKINNPVEKQKHTSTKYNLEDNNNTKHSKSSSVLIISILVLILGSLIFGLFNVSGVSSSKETTNINVLKKQDGKIKVSKVNKRKPLEKVNSSIIYDLSCLNKKENSIDNLINIGSKIEDDILKNFSKEVSVKKENIEGKKLYNQLRSEYTFIKNKKQSNLKKILKTLTKKIVNPKGYKYEIHLIKDDVINAFTFGSHIYITSKMYDFTKNSDELASIIGHEIYHNELGHIKKNIQVYTLNQKVFGNKMGDFSTKMHQIFTAPFNKKDEVMCDLHSIDLINKAGYNVCSTSEIWYRMKKNEKKGNQIDNLLRTHPYSYEREKCANNHILDNYNHSCR